MRHIAALTAALMLGTTIGGYRPPFPNGIPGIDFVTGRTSGNPLNVAYTEAKPLLGASTTKVTVPSKNSTATFVIADSYAGTFTLGSYVTMVSTASLANYLADRKAGVSSPRVCIWVNGYVSAWDAATRSLTLTTHGTTGQAYACANDNNVAQNSLYGSVCASGQQYNIGLSASDWQMNLHVPQFWGANYGKSTLYAVGSAIGDTQVTDWDFRNALAGISSGSGATFAGAINFSNCLLDQAGVSSGYTNTCYLGFSDPQRWTMDRCDVRWNWSRFAVTAKVTQVAAVGDVTIAVDQIPAQHADFRNQYQDASTLIDTNWRIINTSNPTSMGPTRVLSVSSTDNTITIQQDTMGDGVVGIPKLIGAVTKGDTTLNFYTGSSAPTIVGSSLYTQANVFIGFVTRLVDVNHVTIDRPAPADMAAGATVLSYAPGNGANYYNTTQDCPAAQRKLFLANINTVGGEGATLLRADVGNAIVLNNAYVGVVASVSPDGTFVTLDRDIATTIPAATRVYVARRSIRKPLQVGDTLTFFPMYAGIQSAHTANSIALSGLCTRFTRNYIDVLNDFWGAATAAGYPAVVSQNEIAMTGVCDDQHGDFFQYYSWSGASVSFTENYIYWGWRPGEKDLAPYFTYNNRDMTVGQKLAPLMNDILIDNIIIDALPTAPCQYMFYASDTGPSIIYGTRANASGGTRITVGNYAGLGKYGSYIANDYWMVGGSSNAALNGGKPIVSGASDFIHPAALSVAAASPAQGNKVYVSATDAAAAGIGSLLYLGVRPTSGGTPASMSGATLLGYITDNTKVDGTNGPYLTIETALTADLAANAYLVIPQWYDVVVPYTAEAFPSVTKTAAGGYQQGQDVLTLDNTTGIQPGMALKSSQSGIGYSTLVKQVLNATQVQLTQNVQYSNAASASITFGTWVMPCAIAPTRVSNIYFRNFNGDGNGDMLLNFVTAVQGGLSIENIRDMSGNLITWSIAPYKDISTLRNQTAYNPKLAAPENFSITKVAGGYRLDFTAVSGALGYAFTLDGGATWSNSYTDASTIVLPGAVITGPVGANVGVRALNAVNDLGIPVNPGAASAMVAIAA